MFCLTSVFYKNKRKNIRKPFNPSDPWHPQWEITQDIKSGGLAGDLIGHPYVDGSKVCFFGCCKWEEESAF